MFLNNNKQLIRRMKVLQNTIRCQERRPFLIMQLTQASLSVAMVTRCPFCKCSPEHFLAGKRLVTYIFLFADFWASRVYYFDAYTVNLELDDNFKVFFDLVYLYIFIFYRSWSSCNWAAYPEAIFVNICTVLWFIFPQK